MTLVHTITTDAALAMSMSEDRALGHRTVMQLWGHVESPNPRADLSILWSITNIDVTAATGTLTIRSNSRPPNNPDWCRGITTRPTELATDGDTVTIRIDLVAQRTPSIPVPAHVRERIKTGANGTPREPGEGLSYRANPVPVPSEQLENWATDKLARNGLHAHALTVLAHHTINIPTRRIRYPVATLRASGTISDTENWSAALTRGIGKGKAFGLGTIVTL